MILFRSLPNLKQQALEKLIETGGIQCDGDKGFAAKMRTIEKIRSTVAKEYAKESNQRPALLSREAM